MLFRLLLVLAIIGGLVVFTLQNTTPAIALIFLGIQFPALPLSWWVLGAIAAGATTTLVIQLLFGLASFATGQAVRTRLQSNFRRQSQSRDAQSYSSQFDGKTQSSQREREDDSVWQDWSGYDSSPSRNSSEPVKPRSTAENSDDDWERPMSDDWEDSEPQDSSRSPSSASRSRLTEDDLRNFEVKQTPKQTSQSGSVYSYGYREPEGTGVGRSEKVVDAEYRVIVPPYSPISEEPPVTPPEENADDWFEESSDEFEDDPPRR